MKYIAVVLIHFFLGYTDMKKTRQPWKKRDKIVYVILSSISLTIGILLLAGVRIKGPAKIIEKFIYFIIGKGD